MAITISLKFSKRLNNGRKVEQKHEVEIAPDSLTLPIMKRLIDFEHFWNELPTINSKLHVDIFDKNQLVKKNV